ncbi:TspO/MBR family protein [Nocardia brasiliensis]|uniref:Tryptophan-rich sensory protein n=1 Tax=Nocardia brasiliensis (strain ATCC 700358 / HUJEG-1) TaxID=1133849 RepID=K0EZW7_NOCB7|nr:TspO/MBR family protein [Nocardia brasiliensis]AFU02639.1 tryptophan-rich sensory protein [Nocardia brasiliensis ATCC 700358]
MNSFRPPPPATLLCTGAAVAATALAGSAATGPGSAWYRRVNKPGYQPPSAVFPIVWTLLYGDIAVTSAYALENASEPEKTALRAALAVNLVLNASWSWVFFRAHRLGTATAVAAALTASSADLSRRVSATHPVGRASVLYPAWCAFATMLSAGIWRRNR